MRVAYIWFVLGVVASAWATPCLKVAAAAGSLTKDEAWIQIGLRFEALSAMVNDEVAYSRESRFLSAIIAINSLLSHGEKDLFLLPKGYKEKDLPQGNVIASIGGADFYITDEPQDLHQVWRKVRPHWIALYQSGGWPIRFEPLLKYVRPYAHDNESLVVARAFNEAFNEADPHSRMVPVSLQKQDYTAQRDLVGGIGVYLGVADGRAWVREALPGGKADKRGVRAGDEILAIDGVSPKDLSFEEIQQKISGRIGTPVTVTFRRGKKVFVHTMNRRWNPIPEAIPRKLRVDGGIVGHLQVYDFRSPTLIEDARIALKKFNRDDVKGLVLDLRGNGGGSLDWAIDFLSLFIGPKQPVLLQQSINNPQEKYLFVTDQPQVWFKDLVVLIDERSASASELVAGVLQSMGRAYVVGERSFGKGTIQDSMYLGDFVGPFQGKPLLLFQTEAMYFLPNGQSPQVYGVPPDFEAHFKPDATTEELRFEREGDLFNAYENPHGPIRLVPDKNRDRIRRCLSLTGNAQRAYYSTRPTDMGLDYQLHVATDVLKCLW